MSETRSTSSQKDSSRNRALECAKAALDKRAENVKILDLTGLSDFCDYFVIASGMSDRQVQSIADSVQFQLKHSPSTTGTAPPDSPKSSAGAHVAVEGYQEGRWVLIDCGDVVVHIFLDALREYYDLETLWADAPRVKIPPESYGIASRLN